MKFQHSFLPVLLTLGLAACDNGAKQKGGDKASEGDDEGGGDEGNAEPAGDGDFDGWCSKAGEIKPVQAELAEYFGKFCDGGKATALMKSTLVTKAYSGSGKPTLKSIEKLSSDKAKKETTAYFAVGIKLPISIKDHFDKVAPKAGDKTSAERLAKASKAKSTKFEVKDEFKEDGKYHVRGWRVHSINTQNAGGIDIDTETVARTDQFALKDGSLYAYTQVTEEGISTVKAFNMLTAGIQVDGTGYLLTIAFLTVDNRGLDAVAESKIKDTANALVSAMYKAAEEAGGAGLTESEPAGLPQE